MTLAINVQLDNAKAKAAKLGFTEDEIAQLMTTGETYPEKVRAKRTIEAFKTAIVIRAKEQKKLAAAPTPTETPMPSGDSGLTTDNAASITPTSKKEKAPTTKRDGGGPARKDKAIKSPTQSRTAPPSQSKKAIGSGIVAVLRGESGGMDYKNTVLNAIRAAEKKGTKKVTSEDIKAIFDKHDVKMDDAKLRMSLGNLARDARIKRLGHGEYRSLAS